MQTDKRNALRNVMSVKWIGAEDSSSQKYKNISEIILVAQDEKFSRDDYKLLQAGGFRKIQIFSSGVSALQYVLKQKEEEFVDYTCVLIMHEKFYDMDAFIFLSLLSMHPLGKFLPKAVISDFNESVASYSFENKKLKYKSLGCIKVLQRPLTPNMLLELVDEAFSHYQENMKKFIEEHKEDQNSSNKELVIVDAKKQKDFEKILANYVFVRPSTLDFEKAYQEGIKKLNHKIYSQAIEYFKRAGSNQSPYRTEALFNLYQIYAKNKDKKNIRTYLTNLCQQCIDVKDFAKLEKCIEISTAHEQQFIHPIFKILGEEIKKKREQNIAAIISCIYKHFTSQEISQAIFESLDKEDLSKQLSFILYNYPEILVQIKDKISVAKSERRIYQKQKANIIAQSKAQKNDKNNEKIIFNLDKSEKGLNSDKKNETINSDDRIKTKKNEKNKSVNKSQSSLFDDDILFQYDYEPLPKIELGTGQSEELFQLISEENKDSSFLSSIFHIIKKVVKDTK